MSHFEKRKTYGWKLLTLTVASSKELQPQLDHLINSFRKLRQRKAWSADVLGGMYVLEITHGAAGWHAHIHVIMYSKYIAQHYLSRLWKNVSGSPIVDIRQVKNINLANYLTQYLTKWDLPAEGLAEAESAMKNRRLWSPFGAAHDLNSKYKPQAHPCPCCGSDDWLSQRQVDRGYAVEGIEARAAP